MTFREKRSAAKPPEFFWGLFFDILYLEEIMGKKNSMGKISMTESESEQKLSAYGSFGESPARGISFKDAGMQDRPMGAMAKKAPSTSSTLGENRPMGAESRSVPFRK